MQRRQQSPEGSTKRMVDIVKRLEDGLFKSASTMVCYLLCWFLLRSSSFCNLFIRCLTLHLNTYKDFYEFQGNLYFGISMCVHVCFGHFLGYIVMLLS